MSQLGQSVQVIRATKQGSALGEWGDIGRDHSEQGCVLPPPPSIPVILILKK